MGNQSDLEHQNEIDRLKELIKRYRFDYLTGLKQRMDFQYEVSQKFRLAPFYLVMYDVVGLHMTNMTSYAHGDALIVQVANDIRMQNGACCAYRLNGDEFFVVHNKEPLDVAVENATHAYVLSSDYGSFSDMFDALDKALTKRKTQLKRRREDLDDKPTDTY